jgi:YVTN family beta-propeller protein
VGNSPFGVAYDSGKDEVFVTNVDDDTVSVISDSSNAVIATVPVGEVPQGLTYDSGKSEIFVANFGSNTTSVISDTNNTVLATVASGAGPEGVTDDSGKGEIFVTNFFTNMWSPFNLAPTNFVSDTVKVISDSYPLTAPSVSSSLSTLVQGQTSNLTSAVTTGASPYTYQWFSEAPGASTFSPVSNGIFPSYSFATTASTPTGNWTFMLQVTDATGTAVNSTATTVTVNAPPPTSPATIISIVILIVAVTFGAVALAHKKSTRTNSASKQTTK